MTASTKTLNGTQTEKNILIAFAGESQARNRYTYFAGKARDEGYMQISAIFEETANQEKEHAKRLFKLLEGSDLEISATFPAGMIGNTAENLCASAGGENHEWQEMYPSFARIAREEGFADIAGIFESISVAEKYHAKRYETFLTDVKANTIFKKNAPVYWRCRNCGYIHEGTEALNVCPACVHPKSYFEIAVKY